MEVDDGSGWIKVSNSEGNKGLIPASYIELMQPDDEQASVRVSSAEGSGVYGARLAFVLLINSTFSNL